MKFPKRFLVVLTLVLAGLVLIACKPGEETVVDASPTFSGVGAASIKVYDEFNPLQGVTATDPEDGNLTASINVKSNNVDINVIGTYQVVYEVVDSAGNRTTVTRTVNVTALDEADYPLANYLSGVNLSLLPGEEKAILFAAAERYLIDNVYAGVPIWTRATRVMYSSRTQLFSPTYNSVMGFGTAFSQFSADDSTVKMFGETLGNPGEYTWRASFSTDPTGFNPWMADDSNTAMFTDMFHGGLYDFFFDETKTGYEILPSLAKSEPIPVNPEVINGKTYAKIWRIEIRDDLQWKFHPNTVTTGYPAGFEKLDVNDWLWTWRYAMENQWFRARTGGGDFVSQGIKGAADFLAGRATWDQVGIRLATGTTNTLELEYIDQKHTFDVKYSLAGATLVPINREMFESVGAANYGKGPTTVASSGIYYFDTFTAGQFYTFKKNTLHPNSALYNYTGYQYRYVQGSEQIFQEFLEGRLESASVPASRVNEYLNDPRVKVAPDAATWRLLINGFGTTAARDAFIAKYPELGLSETYVPEPILSYTEMRQALYYGIDRLKAAVEVSKINLPAHTYFASTYFIDAESGLSVRGTDAGQAVFDDFAGSSYGFVPDAAVDLFKDAVAKAIADGHYVKGTASAYTVIELNIVWASSGNTAAQALVANIVEQYEALLVDDTNFVRLKFNVSDVQHPNQYYRYYMVANYDLGIGAISGSLLDAPSFLDVFSEDGRGGFTLDWGIDTSTPRISVAYKNLAGVTVYEKWSYDALVSALNGKIYIKSGGEQKAFTSADSLINAYFDMAGKTVKSSVDATVPAADLNALATARGFDEVVAKVVTDSADNAMLYIISRTGTDYELFVQTPINLTAEEAIKNDSGSGDDYVSSTGPLTDAQIAANEYIADTYGYETVAEIATALKIAFPASLVQVYAVDWNGWSDAYVLVKLGNYYIPIKWL